MRVFRSRKNKVVLTEEGIIRKTFASATACDKEAEALVALQGNHAPVLLSRQDLVIETGYIEGDLLLERYLCASCEKAAELATMLANTILSIYTSLNRITFDENFRNYIVAKEKIYRVDFEEVTEGDLEQWCAKLFAFATLYDTDDQVKTVFIRTLQNILPLRKERLSAAYQKELSALAARWRKRYPKNI